MRALLVLSVPVSLLVTFGVVVACGDDDPAATPATTTDSGPIVVADGGGDSPVVVDAAPACPARSFPWATQSKSSGAQVDVRGVARDAAGNVWITGTAAGTVKWDDTPLASAAEGASFVASFDPAGKVRAVYKLMASDIGSAEGIAIDGQGFVYVMGNFEGTATLGTTTLTSTTSQVFVTKLDDKGAIVWAKQSTGTATTIPYGFAVDAQGNAYVAGTYAGSTTFGTTDLGDSGSATVPFAARYSANGDLTWARGWKTQSAGGVTAITANADGSAVMVGYLSRPITFDSFVAGSGVTSTTGAFVTKLDATGHALWAADLVVKNQGTDRAQLTAVTTDGAGRVYVGGYAQGSVGLASALPGIPDAGPDAGDASPPPFDAGPITRTDVQGSPPNYDMLLAQYDAQGKLLWARHAGAPGVAAAVTDLAANDDNGVFVLGSKLYGQPKFDAVTPTNTGAMFLTRYDAQGTVQWVVGNDGVNDAPGVGDPRALAVGAPGSGLFIAGSFTDTWTFGMTTLKGGTSINQNERTGFVTRVCE